MTRVTLEQFYALKPVIACLLRSLDSKPNSCKPELKTQYLQAGNQKIHTCKICVKTHLAARNYCLPARVRLTTVQSVGTFRSVENMRILEDRFRAAAGCGEKFDRPNVRELRRHLHSA